MGIVEMNIAGGGRKDGVILADSCVRTRVPRGTALSEDDLTRVHELTYRHKIDGK